MSVAGVYAQDVELWNRELLAAGWTSDTLHVWKSPGGVRYLGPYSAWEQMKHEAAERLKDPPPKHATTCALFEFADHWKNKPGALRVEEGK
jgi:hypothetical protein